MFVLKKIKQKKDRTLWTHKKIGNLFCTLCNFPMRHMISSLLYKSTRNVPIKIYSYKCRNIHQKTTVLCVPFFIKLQAFRLQDSNAGVFL